jgi:tRNA(His) 5'-end guanylyltransferase
MSDDLGDRMKGYESAEAQRRCMPLLPIIGRLDGKGFSKFTKGLKRPYDKQLSDLMVETVKYLVEETNAVCGYTQSDEITLAWYSSTTESQVYFDGRIQKMVSVLAAKCSVRFNKLLPEYLPGKVGLEPVFDCRIWNVPTLEEGANCFLWREFDATKNSISMAAQEYYSHTELMNKNGSDKQEMLFQKGVNWNDFPPFFKRGSYIQRRSVVKKFSTEELEKLPAKHEARTNPDLMIERTEYAVIDMPPFNRVKNRVGVIFNGEAPIKMSEE